MRRLLRRRRAVRLDLDERVAAADREAQESQRRLEAARTHVVTPLRERAQRNQFADMIRQSLREGHA